MNNTMNINGYKAHITYDNDQGMFRGEFINLNGGGADFYADTVSDLYKEGKKSLQVFLDVCKENGISPKKVYSGRLPLRIPADLHEKLVEASHLQGVSINVLVKNTLEKHLNNK